MCVCLHARITLVFIIKAGVRFVNYKAILPVNAQVFGYVLNVNASD